MRYRTIPTMLVCAAATASAGFVVTAVHATEYLDAAQACALMFPQASEFRPVMVALDAAQLSQLAERAGGPARAGAWRVWQARQGHKVLGYVVTDAVIGKFDLIDYAVALDPFGTIAQVEILVAMAMRSGASPGAASSPARTRRQHCARGTISPSSAVPPCPAPT